MTNCLPTLMVAPNGARLTQRDHPRLPVTIAETVAEAKACHEAGAGALHAHVRDGAGAHALDAGLYRELLAEMALHVPGMAVQITTEAVGRYTPAEQRALVAAIRPQFVSVAVREMVPGMTHGVLDPEADAFYRSCAGEGIAVQHIVYSDADFSALLAFARANQLPAPLSVLFVLGRYTPGQMSSPADLDPFLTLLDEATQTGEPQIAEWVVCAFGANETSCLLAAARRGGKCRVGFENNLRNADGSVAENNAERVAEVHAALAADGDGRG
ncbi:MAG: 3-keto-5-aminohexanoate cleavage protein [Pseudomonadota bacterium]